MQSTTEYAVKLHRALKTLEAKVESYETRLHRAVTEIPNKDMAEYIQRTTE